MKKSLVLLFATILLMSSCVSHSHWAAIEGTVLAEDGITVIEGVTITLDKSGKSLTTGTDGKFEFKELDPGKYSVMAQKTGYYSNSVSIMTYPGETEVITISLALLK